MKIVTLKGTYVIDEQRMKVRRLGESSEQDLKALPTPIIGERMLLNGESTEQVTEVVR